MAGAISQQQIANCRQRLMAIASAAPGQADLAEAALLVAAEHRPGLDIQVWLRQLDRWAEEAKPTIGSLRTELEQARGLISLVHEHLGFEGNAINYYDPGNSYLDMVLERRVGIPITLAIVYVALGRRLGLRMEGIGFPGHFLVSIGTRPQTIVDPFSGKILTSRDCEERLASVLGPGAKLTSQHLAPATPREIVTRMLRNLKSIFLERAAQPEIAGRPDGAADREALACCDRLLLLVPDDPAELRDRGYVHGRLGNAFEACADLERALELAPHAPWAEAVRQGLPALKMLAGPLN